MDKIAAAYNRLFNVNNENELLRTRAIYAFELLKSVTFLPVRSTDSTNSFADQFSSQDPEIKRVLFQTIIFFTKLGEMIYYLIKNETNNF